MTASLTFVLGGARSGKSRYAEEILGNCSGSLTYIATAQAFDEEMRDRIAHHSRRRDLRWRTVEAPLDLVAALAACGPEQPVLIDCLTLWLTNVMLAGRDVEAESGRLVVALADLRGPCVVVSNEVGLGIVPDNRLAREFRDHAGRLNQLVAQQAERVYFMVAGLPMSVK